MEAEAPIRGGTRKPARRAAGSTPHSLGWRATDGMTFAQWVDQGRQLGKIGRSAGWWVGDWLRFGNERYGDRYVRAARITGYDVQTLMNMVHVASRVDSSRRRENLSWSHHAEVTAFPPDEQDGWLVRAEEERMSVRCLRKAIRDCTRAQTDAAAGDDAVAHRVCPSCGSELA